MKQWITEEQFNELPQDKKVIWIEWIKERGYTFSKIYPHIKTEGWTTLGFPSIGEMIEYLRENAMGDLDLQIWINNAGASIWTGIGRQENILGGGEDMEPCDALWEAVKELLYKDIVDNLDK